MADKGFFRRAAAAAGIVSGIWTFLTKPRTDKKQEVEDLGKWDFAHRGYHNAEAGVPENSMAAFRLAVVHDSDLERMTGQKVQIEDLTLEEARELRLGGTEETIPSLNEVLETVNGQTPILVEIKVARNNVEALTSTAMELLDGYEGEYLVESFDPRVLSWLRKNRPEVLRGQLLTNLKKEGNTDYPEALDFSLRNLLTNCWTRPDFIAYNVKYRGNLSLRLAGMLYGVPEFDWTIRSGEEYCLIRKEGGVPIFEGFDPRLLKEEAAEEADETADKTDAVTEEYL